MNDVVEHPSFFRAALEQHKIGDLTSAAAFYRAAIDENPRHAPSYCNLGMVHGAQGQHEVALSLARIAVALDPENAIYHNNVGKVLWTLQRYDEAQAAIAAALRLNPRLPEAHHNLGSIWYATGKPAAAIGAYRMALSLDPSRSDTSWDRAWALMGTGDYDRGLEAYEQRWTRIPKDKIWDTDIPEWQGEDLTGKNILVHHEQGYGDTLHFVRFAMHLKTYFKGVRVSLAVPPALYRLMREQPVFDEIAQADMNTPWKDGATYDPPIDFHTPVISVWRWLRLLGHTEFNGGAYLRGPPPLDRLRDPGRFAIGCIWSGSITNQPGSQFKPIDPVLLAPLAEIPGVTLYGLQKHDGLDDMHDSGMSSLIRDCSGQIKDFYDLAAAMAAMDLIVSVDTGPLHLAGALGLPCIGMIPYERCWRWPKGDAKTTPWYSSMHIEAQREPGGWPDVVERVRDKIRRDKP